MHNSGQCFFVSAAQAPGRLVRLSNVLDSIINRHTYPPVVAQLLAEAISLTALLALGRKSDGVFTLQTQTVGAVNLLVVDVNKEGMIRGYTRFDAAAVAALPPKPSLNEIVGRGLLVFSLHQTSAGQQDYQGYVELVGQSLTDAVRHYFAQSEQLVVHLRLGVKSMNGQWRAGGLLLQPAPATSAANDNSGDADLWNRLQILAGSLTDTELLDASLPNEALLMRLFHEDGCRTLPALAYNAGCRCNEDKIGRILAQYQPSQLKDLYEDGHLVVTCEFCTKRFMFTEASLTPWRAENDTP